MCGIAGLVDFKLQSLEENLKDMTDAMHLRGPDGSGHVLIVNENVQIGLGHKRLSIIDLSEGGRQPMSYKHLTITFNGEIYNYKEIRNILLIKRHEFISNSDTEVILHAFEEWGTGCVEHFRGMFAFCIYNKQDNQLFLFRDRIGVKPLFYFFEDGLFLFGSTLDAIARHPRFTKRLNHYGLSSFLQYGFVRHPYSMYEGINKVEPGSYLEFDLREKKITANRYWDIIRLYKKEKLEVSYEHAVKELETILLESFQYRLVADVGVGIFLSGGIDSALITALLQTNSDTQLQTFTIGFKDSKYNEAKFAKNIAKHLKTNHFEHYCTEDDAKEVLTQIPEIYDEPSSSTSAFAVHLIAKLAKKRVKVALSGDGGDELFCGYTAYNTMHNRVQKIAAIPVRQSLDKMLNTFDPVSLLINQHSSIGTRYHRFRAMLGISQPVEMFMTGSSIFTPYDLKELIKGYQFSSPVIANLFDIDSIEQMMIADTKNYLVDDVLVKVDRATMGASFESREPMLDHKIIEYAARLPIEFKKNKRILKDILGNYLPESLFIRKKSGFGIPINKWLRGDLSYLIDNYLNEEAISKIGLLNYKHVEKLKNDFFKYKSNDRKLWTLLMFQMWYQKKFS